MGKRSREKKERRLRETKEKPVKIQPENQISALCLNIIRWGSYLILFTPLIVSGKFFFPFVGPKSLYFMGLAEIIFFAWLILIIYSPRSRPRFNILTLALIFFVSILILSSFLGTDFSRSFWSKPERMTGLLMWFHLLAFFLVISSAFKTQREWLKIFGVSIFAGILVSLAYFLEKGGSEFILLARGGATLGNSSFMGTYLLFNIFLALYLFLNSKEKLKIFSGVSLITISLALFLSDARAAILSFLGGLFLLFLLYLIFIPKKGYLRNLGKVLLAASVITFIIFIILVFQPDSFIQKQVLKMTSPDRLIVWKATWQGFLERPWLGWGPENFDFIFTKYYNPCLGTPECGADIWFDRAHNILFDTLATIGLLGFLSYLGIFLSVFYILGRDYFQEKINFWTAGIFSVVLISYSVQNLTVFDMINSYLMFLLVLGFVGSLASRKEGEKVLAKKESPSLIRWLSLVILIIFLFSFSKFVIRPFLTDYYVIKALQSPDSATRISSYQRALETSPLGKYQIRTFFAEQLIDFVQSEAGKEVSRENLASELDFLTKELEKSKKESPLDYRSYLRLAQLYNLWSQLDPAKLGPAEEVLKKAIELSPTNQQSFWSLAQTKLYQGEAKEALSLTEKAVELEPRLFKSHLIVIQVVKIMGDTELAKKKIEEALKINPDWELDLKRLLES